MCMISSQGLYDQYVYAYVYMDYMTWSSVTLTMNKFHHLQTG